MAAPLTANDPAIDAAPVNILLVDDQPGRLLTYRAILEPLGERLVEASSGEEALKLLMEDEYAVILLDVNMPGLDGFETAHMIHQHPRFEKTPIIFVTAVNVTDMDRLRGYKLGAVDYVMVPVIPEILRSKVVVLAELYRKRRELRRANATLEAEKARELGRLNDSLRSANAELAELVARLRDADRRKDEFLATLAHELRNPLAPLLNAVNVRRLSETAAAADPLQGLMERQLALLVRMIDDLLDVARVTQGKLELRRTPTTLREVLDSAIETAHPVLRHGRHELRVELPDEALVLDGDAARLSQVFANLLNNAAKYSDAGSPIAVSARADGDAIEVVVSDQGIGLDEAQARSIFEMFVQAHAAADRAGGGLGIGLTLVRQLVGMHGGTVEARSAGPGRGSEFVVRLPRAPAGTAAPAAPARDAGATATGGGVRGRRALVLDDNRDAADTLSMMLDLLGFQVRTLYDPALFEETFAAFPAEAVFLDVGMPGRSGYDVAAALRASPGGRDVLLVAVTGWGQPEDRRRSRDAGFDRHLVKPPELAAIHAICRELEQRHGAVDA
ncbi:MAG TPA: response regulator [Luteimonas sp.]|nr:response regulator [Luteimonas sp.]